MPCLDISTNVNLDEFDTDSIFSDLTKTVSRIIGRPENFVMILLKGSVNLRFGGNKEPAAFAEIMAMDRIDSEIKGKLIAEIGSVLHNKLSIPKARFVLKVFEAKSLKKSNL